MSRSIVLCPGQGAQAVGMGRAWADAHPEAAAVFDVADGILGDRLGAPLSTLCFEGPVSRINDTDVSQPAIFTCSVACFAGLNAAGDLAPPAGAAGLSLGEYTALHLAGVFDFAAGLELVASRGRLMQDAAEASDGGMLALIGAGEDQALALCEKVVGDGPDVLVPANFNAPGQIVLSGHAAACDRAAIAAETMGLRATRLSVAGAFHSPLMQPAADRMGEVLRGVTFQTPNIDVWSNVTGARHDANDTELLKERLVQQIVSPVKWAQTCLDLPGADTIAFSELAPGSVLKGLMRRVNRKMKVTSHDEPTIEARR